MFPRIKRGGNEEHPHDYLQVVEAYRDPQSGKPKHRLIANLGRLDRLRDSGQLDALIVGLARFSEHVRVLGAARSDEGVGCRSKLWGPPLVFGRLWEREHLPEVLAELAEGRRFGFDLERMAFALTLQRLCCPGSDLQGSAWVQTVEAPGFGALELHHFYRTAAWLYAVREPLERELFRRDRDLFSREEVDLLFVDTTSVYVYRDTETEWRKRGYSRDRHGELPQFVLAVAVDGEGWPVAWEVYPGNTMDRAAFLKVIEVFRTRLRIRRVIVVADRAMLDQETLKALTEDLQAPFDYILGCKMRRQKEVRDEVLVRAGRYHRVAGNLRVKEVRVEGRRYVVCYNPEEARKDKAAREKIVARLEETLAREPRAVIGNTGFKRFLRPARGTLEIDRRAIEREARFDGKYVLRTNTDLATDAVATTYKGLWRVERIFREEKSVLEVRPIFHHSDENSIGHIVASFLALRLDVDLQRRLDAKGVETSWPDLMRDLSEVRAVRLTLDGKAWKIRTDLTGSAYAAFEAAGVRPPLRLLPLREATM